ncbi:hypothetical protein PCANC_05151 [Puccinia coronata f. sp. avenae]|uniref:Tethering factor for nuclear proteasome STS1 n=1 Tax=Puccinia coronata f. sp. avenae TaxID=200324 RepID=A0A2N5W314_9BASI|nr:hypothetical protein PCANC_05151 [Puccinia coronata f. sp. avenae]
MITNPTIDQQQRMSATHPPVIPPSSMAHQIPFRQPATTVPLNWPFAGTGPPPSSTLLMKTPQPAISISKLTRKRSASDELTPSDDPTSAHPHFPKSALPKRTKRALPHNPLTHDPFNHATKDDQTDLGTALVSLTKNELINLLHGLIQQKPELKATIKSLLPPPSLESILLKLEEVEKQLVEAIPNKRMNREEYIWNRVRVPLNSYVNDCLGCLELSAKTIESRCSSSTGPGSGGGGGKPELSDIYGAVSDQLNLLSQLSLSISKVERLLPNLSSSPPPLASSNQNSYEDLNWNVSYPFQNMLIPSLFQNWKSFIESVHKLIFVDRMIISESLIRKWLSLLDALSSSSSSSSSSHDHLNSNPTLFPSHPSTSHNPDQQDNHTVQRLMVAVRDEALNRFGALVGLKR